MTSNSSRYAFYPFPPTPTRESPRTRKPLTSGDSTTSYSRSSSSSAGTGIMTPSPAGGKQQQSSAPKTPTKIVRRAGQTPQKSAQAPVKLGQTPQKLGQASGKRPLPSKPANTEQPEIDEQLTPKIAETKNVGDKAKQSKDLAKGSIDEAGDKLTQTTGGDEQSDDGTDDADGPLNKANLTGKDAEDALQEAAPEPIKDDEGDYDTDVVGGAAEQGRQLGDKAEQQVEDVNDVDDTTEQAGQTGESTDDVTDDQERQQQQQKQQRPKQPGRGGSLLNGAKSLAGKASGLAGRSSNAANKAGSSAGKAAQDPKAGANDAKKNAEETASDAGQVAKEGVDDATKIKQEAQNQTSEAADEAQDQAEDVATDVRDGAEDTVDAAHDEADDAADQAEDTAEDVENDVEDAADEVEDTTDDAENKPEDAADDAQDKVDGVADEAHDTANKASIFDNLPVDLSVLKGLEVDSSGNIYDDSNNAIGKLTEGDAEDLAGYPIGDDGEILDDDGDLVGRCELLPEEIKRQLQAKREEGEELPAGAEQYLDQVKEEADERVDSAQEDEGQEGEEEGEEEEGEEGYPGLEILNGLTCGIDGLIYDSDGNTVGQVTDGDPEELQHAILNDNGEFIDNEGNVIGHAQLHEEVEQLVEQGIYPVQGAADDVAEVEDEGEEAVPEAEEAAAEIEDQLPGIEALQGRELNESGQILDEQGGLLAAIEDEELKRKLAEGEIDPNDLTIDEQGQVLDAEGNVLGETQLVEGAAERLAGLLDFRILDGKRINKKGNILDDDGEVIGELTDGELKDCVGKRANDRGEVLNKKGELVGHVRVVPGEAAREATRELLEELGEAQQEETPDLSFLEGFKVNKKGLVLDEDGEPIGELESGDISNCAGKKINASGEVLDAEGEVIGRVRPVAQEAEEEVPQEEEQQEQQDLSFLEGYKVNKKGLVLNEDGEAIAELDSGDISACAGKKVNAEGAVVDAEGEVIGTVRPLEPEQDEAEVDGDQEGAEQEQEPEEQEEDNLPPLSTLEGLPINKAGNILSPSGAILGHLTEGDPKKISRAKLTCDASGQIWDNKGHIIGRAETLPQEEEPEDDEPIFSGLEGLRVVEEGWVQDSNGHTVGYVVEGDPKKLLGRTVDEDGDVIDKKGTVVGHAERYEPEDEAAPEEEAAPDLEFLKGKTVTKSGLVMGDEGVPVARLVEGNPKELSGRKLDGEGQFWNDAGKVVGRVELIPEEERERKPEGPFAGLEGLRVIQGGKVADEDGNVVGEIVEGNARRLVGLAVDEDGDIVDKYGNVKGRAEPVPEEEETDFSVLDGMTVNKQGNVVDGNGVPYGKLVQGNAAELAGRQCDENGFVYSDTGKIVGRCEPLPEEERVARPEGPFAGLQGLRVAKGGKVVNEDGEEVGEITEGDPKRLVGLSVDEDGDIIDKFGNTKGHAEPLVEEEQEPVDNSILNNKTVNKQGYVVDEKGIPFGRLVEGNISELAGRKCDENGYIYGDTGKVVGRCEILPENERVARPEGPFAGLEGLRVVKDGFVEDIDGNRVGQIAEGEPKRLVGLHVDEDGDIIDKYGNVKGHAEPWSEEEEQETDLSALAGTVINKAGYAVDGSGAVIGQVSEGDIKTMTGKKVDGQGQIWDDAGNIIGRCELVHGVGSAEGPFAGFSSLQIQKDGTVTTPSGDIVGRIISGEIKKLLGHTVDEDGDVVDKNGNSIGKAERWEPEEKERRANPMSGMRINKEGEVRDPNGDLIGRLTSGDLGHCVGQEIDDAGNVVDVDGNKIGEATLLSNISDEDEIPSPSEEELAEAAARERERETAEKMLSICTSTLERMQPICSQITSAMDRADRTPKEELDEEALVDEVKPLIEEGGRILQECNGSLRGLDPDGKIAAQAKGRAGTGEATPEEYRLADTLKELTTTVVKCVDDAKKKLNDMPHAKKKLNPLWGLLTQPLFQILAAVGLLLAGVLGLVGQLLNALGLGGLVNGLLGGLGINKLLSSLGLGGGDDKKKKRKGKGGPLGDIPVVGGLLGGK